METVQADDGEMYDWCACLQQKYWKFRKGKNLWISGSEKQTRQII